MNSRIAPPPVTATNAEEDTTLPSAKKQTSESSNHQHREASWPATPSRPLQPVQVHSGN
jgi:hypothetical protein